MWTDEAGVGIELNAVLEEWVDDGRDESFDEYVAKCDHWNDCVAVHSSEDESITMKVYEGNEYSAGSEPLYPLERATLSAW